MHPGIDKTPRKHKYVREGMSSRVTTDAHGETMQGALSQTPFAGGFL
jgi:hypothetical protein